MNKTQDDIAQLNERIESLKNMQLAQSADRKEKKFISAYQVGTRIAADLVSGVLVGAGLGYLIDKTFNSSPLALISLLILGSIAGFLNVYRFVKQEGILGTYQKNQTIYYDEQTEQIIKKAFQTEPHHETVSNVGNAACNTAEPHRETAPDLVTQGIKYNTAKI